MSAQVLRLNSYTIHVVGLQIFGYIYTALFYLVIGKLNSLFGMVETIMPLIYAPIYTKVYVASLHVLPGTVFLLSIASTIPVLVIFSWFYHEHRKSVKEKEMKLLTKPEESDEKNENDDMLEKNSQVECLLHEVKTTENSNGAKHDHENNKA